jgi:hypothetical protein
MKYELKKDKSMGLIILIPLLIAPLITLLAIASSSQAFTSPDFLLTFFIYATLFYLIYGFYQKSYYLLDEKQLIVKFGILKMKLDYSQITDIKKVSNWWSSVALSKDKIGIYKNGKLWNYLGPKDEEGFIQALNQKVKSLNFIDF